MRRELIESYYEEYQRELERFLESDPETFSLEAEIHHYIEILEPVLRGDGQEMWQVLDRIISAKNSMEGIMEKEMYIRGDYPGALYLLLVLHYIEQECIAESSAVARPHNKTVERICAYLAANYRQKFSLSEVAARFYLSPYYLSRLFKRVTGQSIVDYINNRRIEAAQKLLETTELSISAVAEQTGFASAAHFRRVFHEVMGTGPLQYRKAHKK